MILLTGGTGFLGAHIVEELRAAKQPIRVLGLGGGDWRGDALSSLKQMGIEICVGNMLDANVVSSALEGCTAVINAAGGLRATGETSLRDIHVDAVRVLCREALKKNVQRLIHISCLGSDEHSDSEYLRLKWESEQLAKSGPFYWTILRPSFLFGEGCQLINLLKPLTSFPFVIPVIGSGLNQFQPISAEDVAMCAVQSLYKKETANQIIDLVGPKSYTLAEFMKLLGSEIGLNKPTVSVTLKTVFKYLKPVERLLPSLQLNRETIQLIISDSVSNSNLMNEYFQVKGLELENHLQQILHQ